MTRQIVLTKFKLGAPEDKIAGIHAGLSDLVERLPHA